MALSFTPMTRVGGHHFSHAEGAGGGGGCSWTQRGGSRVSQSDQK